MNGIVLEGGGARGSYQAGAIKALRKKHIKFSCALGTSIGSINAAFVASNNYKDLYKLWNNVTSEELLGVSNDSVKFFNNEKSLKNIRYSIIELKKIMKNHGIDTSTLKTYLKKYINETSLRKSSCDYGLVTFNITDKKPVEIFKKDIPKGKLFDYIIASAYFPLFKFEKIIDNKYYFDGGIYNRCPYNLLLNKGYDNIYIVRAHPSKLKKYKVGQSNIIEIKSNENLGPLIFFSKEKNRYNFILGFYDTLKVLDNLDGNKYYFRKRSTLYYSSILNKKIINKYFPTNEVMNLTNYKEDVLDLIEKLCDKYSIKRFSIHSIISVLLILKYKMRKDKTDIYYDFIKEIKLNILQK
ncbi:MAG: patatin-like phospholipase family protein [Bacilli bacterium]